MQALLSILGICWQGKITNLKVLDWAKSTSTEAILLKVLLFWAGHIIQMGKLAHAKATVLWWTSTRTKKTRPAAKCYKDTLKSSLKWCGIKLSEQHSSPGLPPLVCTQVHCWKKSDKQNSLQPMSIPQSCFCPCHDNSHPVSHLPLTLHIGTGTAQPFQSNTDWGQTKSSLNPKDNEPIAIRPSHPWIQGTMNQFLSDMWELQFMHRDQITAAVLYSQSTHKHLECVLPGM